MAVALFSKDVELHASAVMVVLDTYPRMIIEIIGNQWSPKQVFKLTQNEKDQCFMRKITPLQRQMISKLDVSGYSHLDVSCIYKLIRHFNLLPVPNQGWGNKPSVHDTKEGDDVERMKMYRNDILHRPRSGLSEQDGKHFFQESYDMAKRLDISIGSPMNGFESKIKDIQCFSVDRQKYMEALEKCAEYQAQLQETRDTPSVDLYYGTDILIKLGSTDNQNASGESQCSIYIRDQSLDVNAVIQKLDYIKEALQKGPYNVIKLDGAESGSLILHITIPYRFFVTKETLHDSLQSFLHHFFLTAGFQCKTGLPIVLAESDRYLTDDNVQDFEYLLEDPLPILKLDVNVQNSAFQNENVLFEEVNKFVTGMYDAIDINGVPVNGSKREVMMFTGQENDQKVQSKAPDMDGFEDNVIDINSDDHWRKLIMEFCHGQIVYNIIPSGILISIGSIFSIDEKRSIRSLERLGSPQRAMEKLLEMFDKKDNEGKWQILKKAFIENDYQWVIDFIEGDFVSYENTRAWTNLMNVFQKTLSANIRPQDILPYLTEKSIISDIDSIEVDKLCGMYGENEAMFRLLTYIPKRKPNEWYPEFINILYENGYAYVVKEIDPKKYEELQVHSSALFDSIDEKPEISNKKINSENRLGQDDWLYLQRTIMQELSIHEKNPMNYEPNESTKENQLAWTAQTKMPATEMRDQMSQNLPLVPYIPFNDAESTDEGYADLEDLETGGYEYDDDGLVQQYEPLVLRNYQQELASPGLQGKNYIIVAPPGSGKTHVALKIIQEHMKQVRARRHPKVIFLVEQGALAQQQAQMCIKYLPGKIELITGETQKNERQKQKSFSECLAKCHVLVITPQLLVNALVEQDVTIDDFTLLVFDECHHAHDNHPYNRIMQAYMDQKLKHKAERNKLPMILGLTASVGTSRAETVSDSINWIKRLMANMDAAELATVQVYTNELSEHVIVPEQVILRTARRKKNYFGEAIMTIMGAIEWYMKQHKYADGLGANKDKVLKAPPVKGSDQYTQWLSSLWRQTAKVFNQESRRFFTTCRTYLDLYNRALLIYEDVRVKEALDFLEENVRKVNENITPDETDNKMNTFYGKSKALLELCVCDVGHQNPKIETLKKVIARTYKHNMDTRGIIFVKTRDLVTAIQNWMKETDGLKALNPAKFVGAQASGEKGGMTKNHQDKILQNFKEGKHKLIIATSVSEEGLDFPNCNLVIRYDHVTNEIAMVQARVRGKADRSQFYVVASEEKLTAEKKELNMMREASLSQALTHVQAYIHKDRQTFRQEIEDLQLQAYISRENTNKEGKIVGDFEFEMRCGRCNEFICISRDIKKIQTVHHAVIGEEIVNHINIIKMSRPTFEGENIKMSVGRVNCKKCGQNLGSIVIYRKAQFPVLKIENFLVSDSHGNIDVYKKWRNAPFVPQELSSQNVLDRSKGTQYICEN